MASRELDFAFIISDRAGVSTFRAFCEEECSSEYLSFVQEVMSFRKIEAPSLRRHVARKICERYIADDAPMALSIGKSAREAVHIGDSPVGADMFATLESEVYQLLQLDIFPRFADSPQYAELKRTLGNGRAGAKLLQPRASARSEWCYSSQEGPSRYYEGELLEGRPHGAGLHVCNGRVTAGTWMDGRLCGGAIQLCEGELLCCSQLEEQVGGRVSHPAFRRRCSARTHTLMSSQVERPHVFRRAAFFGCVERAAATLSSPPWDRSRPDASSARSKLSSPPPPRPRPHAPSSEAPSRQRQRPWPMPSWSHPISGRPRLVPTRRLRRHQCCGLQAGRQTWRTMQRTACGWPS